MVYGQPLKMKVAMMTTLPSFLVGAIIIKTNCDAINDNQVGMLTALRFHCNQCVDVSTTVGLDDTYELVWTYLTHWRTHSLSHGLTDWLTNWLMNRMWFDTTINVLVMHNDLFKRKWLVLKNVLHLTSNKGTHQDTITSFPVQNVVCL